MKCLAIKNSKPDALYELNAVGSERRKANLKWLLDDSAFLPANLTKNPYGVKTEQGSKNDKPPVTPSDSWASKPALKADLLISAETVKQGEKVKVFLKDTSAFKQGYTFFWRIAGVNTDVIPFGNQPVFEIDTSKLPETGKQRIQLVLRNKSNTAESYNASIYFILEAKTTDTPQATASTATPVKEVIPKGAWSRTDTLKTHLRVIPSQKPNQGEKVKFYFKKTSHYNDGSYTFRWSLSGHPELGTGKGKSRTIDTNKLNEGEEYRLVFTVNKNDGSENNTGNVKFTVQAAQQAEATQNTAQTKTQPSPTKPSKSWGGLANAIRVTPSPVQQGDKAIFSIDTSGFNPDTTTFSYYWSLAKQTSNKATLEVDTTNLAPGEHKLSVTLYTKENGQTKRTPIPGGAMLTVTPKTETAGTTSASTETTPTTVQPTQTGRALGQYIRATKTKVDKGNTVTFSLDPAFVEQESQNAKITYYWSLPGHKEGRKANYVVDTTALDEGIHRVQVGMYKTPSGGTRVVSDGWGKFEVAVSGSTLISNYANQLLVDYANNSESKDFTPWIKNIFGNDISNGSCTALHIALKKNSIAPAKIKIGSIAAYDNKQQVISVGASHLNSAIEGGVGDVWKLFHILLEEFGHHIDFLLRNVYSSIGGDAIHDEGAKLAFFLADLAFGQHKGFVFADYKSNDKHISLKIDSRHRSYYNSVDRSMYISQDHRSNDDRYEFFDTASNSEEMKERRKGLQTYAESLIDNTGIEDQAAAMVNIVRRAVDKAKDAGTAMQDLKAVLIGDGLTNLTGRGKGEYYAGQFWETTGFKSEFVDDGNQVMHAMAGIYIGYTYGSAVGAYVTWSDEETADKALYKATIPLGKSLTNSNYRTLSNRLHNTIHR